MLTKNQPAKKQNHTQQKNKKAFITSIIFLNQEFKL